jgi:hypothetical protein
MSSENKEKKTFGVMANLILSTIIVLGVMVFLIILFQSTTKDTKITVSDNSIKIGGMYGDTYSLSDITSLELKESLPAILEKTNGAAIGESRKGYFMLAGLGKCKLFTLADEGPFIYLNLKGQYIIINYKDQSKTKQLFNDISDKINMK